MDVSKILAELRAERALLDEVIANLERVSGTRAKRGRPPKNRAPATDLPARGEEPPEAGNSEKALAALRA